MPEEKCYSVQTCHKLQHTLELAGLIPMALDPMVSHKRRRITTNAQSGNQEWDVNTGVHMSVHNLFSYKLVYICDQHRIVTQSEN